MGLAIFFVLLLIVAGAIIYPLLPGRTPAQPAPAPTEAQIERAVRNLRRARSREGLLCPACGRAYQAGDRFCIGCGGALPETPAAGKEGALVCPSCGVGLHKDDRFCAKCGHRLAAGEAA